MKKTWINLLTVLFVLLAAVCGLVSAAWDGTVEITLEIPSDSGVEQVRCWRTWEDRVYLFLPAYAQPDQTRLYTNTRNTVYINGVEAEEGMTCEGLPVNTELDLAYEAGGQLHHFTLTVLQSENIAAMYIDTVSGTMDHIHERKGNEETGTLRLYTEEGTQDWSGNVQSLKGRGNDSWGKEKKPYSLKLSKEADLLGMGEAQKWVLLANYSDPTHIRNKIVYDAAAQLGMDHTAQCQWVDLYLNGDYAGVYLLAERNEVGPQRVDIPADGSILASMEPSGRLIGSQHDYALLDSNMAFRLRHTAFSQEATEEILRKVDRAIHAADGVDPQSGSHWQDLIDLDSWARKYLVEEVFGNLDANAASQFYYYVGSEEEGILYAGPVWDYDLSMGSRTVWQTQASDALFAASAHIWSKEDHPWFAAMWQHQRFRDRVIQLYEAEFRPLLETLLDGQLEEYARTVQAAAAMNQLRWETADAAEQTAILKTYLKDRMAFLNSYWLEAEEYCIVTIDIRTGTNIATYAVKPGQTLTQFPEEWVTWQGDNYGWHEAETDRRVDLSQPFYQDTDLYLKWYPVEETAEYAPEEAVAEEPISLMRLGPALVFSGMLVLMCGIGLWQCAGRKKKEPAHR